MKHNERFNLIRKIKLNLSDVKPNKEKYEDEGEMENPCWDGYEPYGTKISEDGREVPNCVPVEAKKVKEGFPIPSPSGDEDENSFISRCMGEIGGEYDQDQALAICYKSYRGE
jgi:hypothetical protein